LTKLLLGLFSCFLVFIDGEWKRFFEGITDSSCFSESLMDGRLTTFLSLRPEGGVNLSYSSWRTFAVLDLFALQPKLVNLHGHRAPRFG